MRTLTVVVLSATLAFPSANGSAGNKGAAGKSWASPSPGHASVEGMRNTNGQWSVDRDYGLDRAQERRSDSALEHSNALEPHSGPGERGGKVKGNR